MGKRGGRKHGWSQPWAKGSPYKGRKPVNRYGIAPPPCRTLETMTEEEIAALEREYGVPVRRPAPCR